MSVILQLLGLTSNIAGAISSGIVIGISIFLGILDLTIGAMGDQKRPSRIHPVTSEQMQNTTIERYNQTHAQFDDDTSQNSDDDDESFPGPLNLYPVEDGLDILGEEPGTSSP